MRQLATKASTQAPIRSCHPSMIMNSTGPKPPVDTDCHSEAPSEPKHGFDTATRQKVPLQDFDFDSIDARENGQAATDTSHGPSREEAKTWLKSASVSEVEAEVILLLVFEGKSVRQIAAEIGKSRSWVSKSSRAIIARMLRKKIEECLRNATELPPTPKRPSAAASENRPLSEILSWARCVLNPNSGELMGDIRDALTYNRRQIPATKRTSQWLWEFAALDKVHADLAGITAGDFHFILRHAPKLILREDFRPVVETLVDLLEASHYGRSAERRIKTNSWGGRARVSVRASELLRTFIASPGKGCKLAYLDSALSQIVYDIATRIQILQKAWQETLGTGTRKGRLELFRAKFPKDLSGLSDERAIAVLTGKVLSIATRLAAEATEMSPTSYRRAYMRYYGRNPALRFS